MPDVVSGTRSLTGSMSVRGPFSPTGRARAAHGGWGQRPPAPHLLEGTDVGDHET